MGAILVHGQGAGQGAAADNGHAGQLQKPLQGAVLTVFAVHHWKGSVEGAGCPGAVQKQQLPGAAVEHQGAGDAVRILPAVGADGVHRSRVMEPPPVFCDAHHQRAEFTLVEMGEHRLGGLQRNGVLAGDAAEQEQNSLHGKPPNGKHAP